MDQNTPPSSYSKALLTRVKTPCGRIAVKPQALRQGNDPTDIDGIIGDGSDWTAQEIQDASKNGGKVGTQKIVIHRADGQIPHVSNVWNRTASSGDLWGASPENERASIYLTG
jgi:hypothetical protein